MWIGERIYFTSDRDGTNNLYAWDGKTRKTEQLTTSKKWDVRWPHDDGAARIVYEIDGELEVYDLAARRSTRIAIDVPDDGLWMRPERVSAAERVEDFGLSPKGERAVFIARGEIFTAPIEKGPTRNLSETPGAHERWARWSPDGKRIAYVSDRTGEDEIWLVDQDGRGEPEQLTRDGRGMRYAAEWSPDGAKLAFAEKEGRVFVLDVASRKSTEVANEPDGQIRDYTWSPDSGYLAFSMTDPMGGYRSVWVWSAGDGKARRVTSEMFDEGSPAWDPEGKYLYFLGDREFAPQISALEFNYASDRMTSIYALALRKDVPHPFAPESDEVKLDDEKKDEGGEKEDGEKNADGKGDKDKDKPEKVEPLAIEFEGLDARVARVPLEADNYGGLAATKGRLLYVRGAPFYYGRDADIEPSLRAYSLEDREEKTIAEDIRGYALSDDGSKALVRQGNAYKLYSTDPKKKEDPKTVSTAGLMVDRVPAEEWRLIFDEVWRRFRDFFYVDNMHGYDWDALRRQYEPQLEHVAHRSDLNYVIGEMISELAVGHAYIAGGDWQVPKRAKVALLGADLALDRAAGRYRIVKIFRGQNEEPRYRSPLTEIGVDAREGDYILAIDGEELEAKSNPYEKLRDKADRPVRLTLNDRPQTEGAREVTFQPIDDEDSLRYLDWVERNRARVDKLSGGKVGYLHIPDMGADGIREFIKWYYPQIRKLGLVVDARGNGGGNVSQMIIERLRRELLGVRFSRTFERPATYPGWTFRGPMACLLDEDSASDGDIFPHMFRQAGLGPLIGKRSWGGVVGITNHGPLVDGGSVNVPQFGTNGLDGSWIIEGHGVDPDIVVENDAKSLLEGRDPQLERAVAEVLNGIAGQDPSLPTKPAPAPVKTK
jgi:tricorn protease